MVVASAISQMCDTKDLKLMFEFDERLKLDVDRYLYLTKVPERVKVLKDFTLELELFGQKSSPTTSPADMKTSKPRAKKNVVALRSKADIVAIPPPEVSTLEADMKPYSKPDSDPEDDDDDPTLIRRDKPTAPMYVRYVPRESSFC